MAMNVFRFAPLLITCGTAVLMPAIVSGASSPKALQAPVHLLCESLETPMGIDVPLPRFSWQLNDSRFGAKQSAFELQIATR